MIMVRKSGIGIVVCAEAGFGFTFNGAVIDPELDVPSAISRGRMYVVRCFSGGRMVKPFLISLGVMAASVAAVSMCSCSDGEPVTVNERMLLREGDTLVPKGGGCVSMKLPGSGGASAGGGTGDISVTEGPEESDFVVRVFSDQELLTTRSYGVAMLRAAQVDEFTVTTHSGAVYVLRYWGGACTNLDASAP